MIGNRIGHRLDPYLQRVVTKVLGDHGNPNYFTLMGFLATLIAALFILIDFWIIAGLAIILSGLCDLFDGVVARNREKVTAFGGFLDSVLDRYSDLFLLLAFLVYYLRRGEPDLVILTAFVSIGTALIPYARARAEAVNVACSIGLMERAERIILLSAGTLFHLMEPVLWILAVLTHVTVLQRLFHVWRTLRPSTTVTESTHPHPEASAEPEGNIACAPPARETAKAPLNKKRNVVTARFQREGTRR